MIERIWQADFQQATFRQLTEAFSRPGTLVALPESNGSGALAVLATLVDGETRLADPHGLLSERDWLRLQLQASPVEKATYIVCKGLRVVDFEPCLGTLASPEHGATLIVQVAAVRGGEPSFQLSGPGIETTVTINPQGLNPSWLQQRADWNRHFPLGVDMLLVADDAIVALPRTTRIKETR